MAPFAGYESFEACTHANSDKDDPEAYCAAIKQEVEGEGALSDAEAEAYRRLTGDTDDRLLVEFRNPEEIRRVEQDGGTVVFKRVMFLSPGLWADAGSKEYVDYNADAIKDSADQWVDIERIRERWPEWGDLPNARRATLLNEHYEDVAIEDAAPVNFLHGPAMYAAETLNKVGEIPLDSIIVDDEGRMYGDLSLHGDSPQSETVIELMDETLEAATDPGRPTPPVGPSVEIPADDIQNTDDGTKSLQRAWFNSVGVVFNPASRPVELETQARERPVAMTADDGHGMLLRHGDEPTAVRVRRLLKRIRVLRERAR